MAIGKPTDKVYRFKIDAYTPETMPMARLAEYMAELAAMLGEPKAVHFQRILPGSTIIVHRVEREAVPKVRERIREVRRREAPVEAIRAYNRVNRMLREDNGIGALQERGTVVIQFPGRDTIEERYPPIRQEGSIEGQLTFLGGSDESKHVRLLVEGREVSGLWTDSTVAKQLRHHMFDHVRVRGRGSWYREPEGGWSLKNFRIEGFDPLSDATLSEALEDIRKLNLNIRAGALEELGMIRHGPRASA